MLLFALASLLAPCQALFDGIHGDQSFLTSRPPTQGQLQFELRHYHAASTKSGLVVFSDATRPSSLGFLKDPDAHYSIQSRGIRAYRPVSHGAFMQAWSRSRQFGENERLDWGEWEVPGPDIERREVLLELAKMTNNAYVHPKDADWYNLGPMWNNSYPFGWEPDADGFRGRVFATPDNGTVVISIKGTSATVFGDAGPTAKKDKFNDNMLFSCCCARIDWTWTTVCGCYRGGWKCDQDCLERALIEDPVFYPVGINLYNNVSYMYPDSNIWIIGHSLGGALASLIGVTFGAPVVAFESPGERMAARRLHLPSPPSTQHITHVYHTADPIAMGTCNGILSTCAIGGFAMESRCHLGKTILYDTVSNLSWSVDVRKHTIVDVVGKILAQPWAPSVEIGREVPEAKAEDDCTDCYQWEFGDFPATNQAGASCTGRIVTSESMFKVK